MVHLILFILNFVDLILESILQNIEVFKIGFIIHLEVLIIYMCLVDQLILSIGYLLLN